MRLVLCCMLLGGLVHAADPPEVTLQRLSEYYASPEKNDLPWQDRVEMINAIGARADAQPVLILALTTDRNPSVTVAAATQLGWHPTAVTVLRTAAWNPQELARYTVTIRAEAARSLGRIARAYGAGDAKLSALIKDLTTLARENRVMAAAAVDAIALCGMDKAIVLQTLRDIAESRLVRYSDLARVRVVQWWRAEGSKELKVTDSLEKMLSAGNTEWVRLTAAHALIVADARTALVTQALKDISGPTYGNDARDYARGLLRGDRAESDFLVTAGPAISAVCARVTHASAP